MILLLFGIDKVFSRVLESFVISWLVTSYHILGCNAVRSRRS